MIFKHICQRVLRVHSPDQSENTRQDLCCIVLEGLTMQNNLAQNEKRPRNSFINVAENYYDLIRGHQKSFMRPP